MTFPYLDGTDRTMKVLTPLTERLFMNVIKHSRFLVCHSQYLTSTFRSPRDQVAKARLVLKDVKFDTFVGRGLSGALVIPLLAQAMRKRYLIVRKPSDNTHSGNTLEGTIGKRWVFVDDFIETGATLRVCYQALNDLSRLWKADIEFIGAYLYNKPAQWCSKENCTDLLSILI